MKIRLEMPYNPFSKNTCIRTMSFIRYLWTILFPWKKCSLSFIFLLLQIYLKVKNSRVALLKTTYPYALHLILLNSAIFSPILIPFYCKCAIKINQIQYSEYFFSYFYWSFFTSHITDNRHNIITNTYAFSYRRALIVFQL